MHGLGKTELVQALQRMSLGWRIGGVRDTKRGHTPSPLIVPTFLVLNYTKPLIVPTILVLNYIKPLVVPTFLVLNCIINKCGAGCFVASPPPS